MDVMMRRRELMMGIGKTVINLYNFDTDTVNAFWRANSPLGELVLNRTGYRASSFIKVKPNTIYTVNYNVQSLASAAGMVFFPDNSGSSPISGIALYVQTKNQYYYSFETPSNCQFLTISIPPRATNVQLEIGSTPSPYVPYKP